MAKSMIKTTFDEILQNMKTKKNITFYKTSIAYDPVFLRTPILEKEVNYDTVPEIIKDLIENDVVSLEFAVSKDDNKPDYDEVIKTKYAAKITANIYNTEMVFKEPSQHGNRRKMTPPPTFTPLQQALLKKHDFATIEKWPIRIIIFLLSSFILFNDDNTNIESIVFMKKEKRTVINFYLKKCNYEEMKKEIRTIMGMNQDTSLLLTVF